MSCDMPFADSTVMLLYIIYISDKSHNTIYIYVELFSEKLNNSL